MDEIKPRYEAGEPLCASCRADCAYRCAGAACIPALRRDRDIANARIAELEAERDRLQGLERLYHQKNRCQCSDDEACGHVLRAEAAEAKLATERERLERVLKGISRQRFKGAPWTAQCNECGSIICEHLIAKLGLDATGEADKGEPK